MCLWLRFWSLRFWKWCFGLHFGNIKFEHVPVAVVLCFSYTPNTICGLSVWISIWDWAFEFKIGIECLNWNLDSVWIEIRDLVFELKCWDFVFELWVGIGCSDLNLGLGVRIEVLDGVFELKCLMECWNCSLGWCLNWNSAWDEWVDICNCGMRFQMEIVDWDYNLKCWIDILSRHSGLRF